MTSDLQDNHQVLGAAHRRRARDRGASLVEYALLVALIAIVCFSAVVFFGGQTSQKFSDVGKSVQDL